MVMCASAYIDNLYFPSTTVKGCCQNADLVESSLRHDWGLIIKDSSREVMACKGARDLSGVSPGWEVVTHLNILGHHISNDNGIRAAWNALKPRLWRAFFINCRGKDWKRLGLRRRCTLIGRAVGPVVAHAVGTWPPQKSFCDEMDALQRRMYGLAAALFPSDEESRKEFNGRVARTVRPMIGQGGWWSRLWMQRAVSWKDHLDRDFHRQCCYPDALLQSNFSWAAALQHEFDASSIEENRQYFVQGTRICTRTGTRNFRGKVHARWNEGTQHAYNMIS